MSIDQLVNELHKLNRTEKLQAMQILVHDLAAAEDALLTPGETYHIWSPHDSYGAAQTMLEALEKKKGKQKQHGV